jgi:hypothetical protein
MCDSATSGSNLKQSIADFVNISKQFLSFDRVCASVFNQLFKARLTELSMHYVTSLFNCDSVIYA